VCRFGVITDHGLLNLEIMAMEDEHSDEVSRGNNPAAFDRFLFFPHFNIGLIYNGSCQCILKDN
jgi:hypothetical protein